MKTLIEDTESGDIFIWFENSSGELEYTQYKPVDGGSVDVPLTHLATYMALNLNVDDYEEYDLVEA